MLKKANIQWSVKTLTKMVNTKKISFDNAVQRGHCWDKDRKSLLIHSILAGYPIPAFFAAKSQDDKDSAVYDMLDGKQRSNALVSFLSEDFALANVPQVEYEDDDGDSVCLDVNGMIFSELPECLKDAISDYSLTVYYFDGITEDEISELFWRLNNGKPLTAIELTRVKTKSKAAIQALAKHELFSTILTDSALSKFAQEEIILKALALIYTSKPSLDTKYIRAMCESMDVSAVQVDELNLVFDTMLNHILAIKEQGKKSLLKTITTRTHFLSCCYIQHKANKDGKERNVMPWMTSFFSSSVGPSTSNQYNDACRQGSSKAEAVDDRLSLCRWSFDEACQPQSADKAA